MKNWHQRRRVAHVRHGDDASQVIAPIERGRSINAVVEESTPRALPALAVTERVSALDHEPLDDAMKRQAIVETSLGQQPKIFHRPRGLGGKELDFDLSFVGLNHRAFRRGTGDVGGGLRAVARPAAPVEEQSHAQPRK